MKKIHNILTIIKTFEPIGVGSKDLRECLLIQLNLKGKKDTLAWHIVDKFLTECSRKQFTKIEKALDVPPDKVRSAMKDISKLNPKPGRKYSDQDTKDYIIPDIYIKKIDNEYHVISNKFDIPNIRINTLYQNLIKDKTTDIKTKDYIKDKMRGANFLIKCLNERWKTMSGIINFILKEQKDAIEKGRSFLKPLPIKQAAKKIGRHESTISRAVSNKYIDTPSGIFALKEFFSMPIPDKNGNGLKNDNGNHSNNSIKREIKAIIDNENKKKPLSDKKIQNLLKEKEIDISRRVIAKYREELKILPSYLRKT